MTDYQRNPNPRQQLAEIYRKPTKRVELFIPFTRYGCVGRLSSPLTIELPPVPRDLNPNKSLHQHWRKYAKAKDLYQAQTRLALRALQVPQYMLRAVEAHITCYVATKRRRDADNFGASLKCVWDVFTEWGLLWDDDQLKPFPAEFVQGKPRVEITLTNTKGNQ